LRPVDSEQGGHDLLNLHTGKVITRRTVTPVPMTQRVIDLVHAMATRDGMPDVLKVTNRYGILLNDSSNLAGVDEEYEDNDEDSDYEFVEDEQSKGTTESFEPLDANELGELMDDPDLPELERRAVLMMTMMTAPLMKSTENHPKSTMKKPILTMESKIHLMRLMKIPIPQKIPI
jgi:hypothetical protein